VVKTTGSILVLNPAYDLSLGSADVTGGSIGQFSVQFQITVTNNYDTDVKPEIVMICANQGLITTQLGSSSLQTGMLTKQLVLETISKKKTYENAQQQHSLEGSGLDHEMSGGFASSSMSGGSLSLTTKTTRKARDLKKYF
jgi:hypothetical protein